ncbi:MAG: NAD(P)/FAD-dependent oxidoreductase [Anaerovoracaceae bacterium]
MNKGKKIYPLIIIGAGAAGLFAGASIPQKTNGLILEKSSSPGKKLLITGNGQCNLTRGGSIKDFIPCYGNNGRFIRSILYGYNNLTLMNFFQENNVPLLEREDGKVFPKSLKAADILSILVKRCTTNGFTILPSTPITSIKRQDEIFTLNSNHKEFHAKNVVIATGGCSYPVTGSDGSLFPILASMGISISPLRPGLAPIHVEDYPYKYLAGVTIPQTIATINDKIKASQTGDLLFTHNCFSGPVMLNLSRYAAPKDKLSIDYYPQQSWEQLVAMVISATKHNIESPKSNRKQLVTLLYETLSQSAPIPKRFIESLCYRCSVHPSKTASTVSNADLKSILRLIKKDEYTIVDRGFKNAMVTAGGVSLNEVNSKTLESNKYPGLYFAGEVLNVDGDTGGYNLQFAFSSAYAVAKAIACKA